MLEENLLLFDEDPDDEDEEVEDDEDARRRKQAKRVFLKQRLLIPQLMKLSRQPEDQNGLSCK